MFRYNVIITAMLCLFSAPGISQWEVQNSGVTVDLNDICFVDRWNGWAVGDSGTVICTTDGGQTWIKIETGINNNLFRIECFDKNTVYIISKYSRDPVFLSTKDGGVNWNVYNFGDTLKVAGFFFQTPDTGWVSGGDEVDRPVDKAHNGLRS